MKIINFSYFDKTRNWGFENLTFSKLTLLVGASGVGKTQILRAITNLKNIAEGQSFSGVKWKVTFESLEGRTYLWEGEYDTEKLNSLLVTGETIYNPAILQENLSEDGKEIAERNTDRIIFQDKETVKLAAHQSVIYLLKAEVTIKIIGDAIDKINVMEMPRPDIPIYLTEDMVDAMRITIDSDINYLFNLKWPIISKLVIVSRLNNAIYFNSIKQRFTDIFPQIEDIRIKEEIYKLEHKTINKYFIQIKERGVKEWISQENMSSGMIRSLMQISELYLCAEGSVILIDEFENSLGVNCIDELTNDILSSQRNIQFILTSHHPYIINNIPYQHWKIVTRKGGKVMIKNAADYRIGESKHDYFMQLLQLEDFCNGVD